MASNARRSGAIGAALLGLLVLALAPPARASLLERLPLETLQERAEAIAVGRVLSTRSVLVGQRIRTETVLAIDTSFRGPRSGTITVTTPGGRIEGRQTRVRGVPRFAAGETVLVFLFRSGDRWAPVGLFQGVWRLQDAGAPMARPSSPSGAKLVDLRPGPYAVDGPTPRSVAELVGRTGGGR